MIRLAELRLRQGRLEEADQLLKGLDTIRTRSGLWPSYTWPAPKRAGPRPPGGAGEDMA